jgi:hypothetical protein
VKQEDLWHTFRKASKSVYASVIVVSPVLLSFTVPENAEQDPDDPQPADAFHMVYSSDCFSAQV